MYYTLIVKSDIGVAILHSLLHCIITMLFQGLAQKIIRKKLKPSKLVRMTPDEMASKELHQWREKEIQSVSEGRKVQLFQYVSIYLHPVMLLASVCI